MSDQLLKQLGVEQQILQQMVDEQAALAEADRLGISVSDEEVRQRIFATPAFQENGAFIGEARYQQLLRAAAAADDCRPSSRTTSATSCSVEKLRGSLTDWLSVADKDLEQEYRRRNDKVKLAVVSFTADTFRTQVDGQRRRSRQLLRRPQERLQDSREAEDSLSADRRRRAPRQGRRAAGRRRARLQQQHRAVHDARTGARQPHPAQDRRQGRCGGEGQGGRPAEAGAAPAPTSPISRRKTPKTRPARRTAATSITSAAAAWCPSSTRRSFAMQPGQISDLVKTQFGYHIIKLVDKKNATTRTLAEVRQQITDQLAYERAQAQAADLRASAREADQQAGRPRQGRQGAGPRRCRSPASSRATSRSSASGRRRKPPTRAFEMKTGRRRRAAARVTRVRVRDAGRETGSVRAEARRSEGTRARRGHQAEGARRSATQKAAELAAKLQARAPTSRRRRRRPASMPRPPS